MRIAFWGSEPKSAVTSNMIMLAVWLACRKGYRITLLQEEQKELQRKFHGKHDTYAHSYIRTLIERLLYYIPKEVWQDKGEGEKVAMIKYLEANMDLVLIHMSDCTDTEARNLMRNAHVLVMNMKQEWRSFDRYYACYANLSANILLLIGNYYYDTACSREEVQKKYRIGDGRLMVIPYDPEYELVQGKGELERYVRCAGRLCRKASQRRFYKAVEAVAERLISEMHPLSDLQRFVTKQQSKDSE